MNSYNMLIYRILLIIVISCISTSIFSQHYAAKFYSSKDFPNINLVYSLLVDDQGSLWIGSYTFGLTKFDGKDFEGFNQKSGLLTDRVTKLVQDNEGAIWAGDGEFGYSRIKGDIITKFNPKDYGVKHFGGYYSFDSSKELLLSTIDSSSLSFDFVLNKFKFNPQNSLDSIISKYFTLTIGTKNEFVWFQKSGAFLYKNNHISSLYFHEKPNLQLNPVLFQNQIIYANTNKLYCKSLGHEINEPEILCDITTSSIDFLESFGNEIILFYKKNKNTTILRIYNSEFNSYKEFNFKFSSKIRSCIKDKAGNYWIGTQNGLIKIIPSLFVFSNDEENMLPNIVTTQEDKKGNIWFGSGENGIAYYNGEKIIPTEEINQVYKDILDCSILDKSGNVLFNTASGKKGLLSINSGKEFNLLNIGSYAHFIGRNHSDQIILGMSKFKGLWISMNDPPTDNPDNWIKIGIERGLKLENILTVSEDKFGNYWMGRTTQGISVYLRKKDTIYNYMILENALNPGAMTSTSDEQGNIWFGTNKGLYFLDMSKWNFDSSDLLKYLQLISPEILGTDLIPALRISNNNLYIGTNNNLAILDLKLFYEGKISITLLNSEFGYEGGTINQNGISLGNDGRIWITASQNVTSFNSKLYYIDTAVPHVILDEIRQNKLVTKISEHIIQFTSGTTSLNIKAHTTNCPYLYNNIQYIFKINNEEFTQPQNSSLIELRNLSPGLNKIQVQAIKNGSILSPLVSCSFYIKPYWWENKWLWWLIGIIISLLSIFLYRKNIEMAIQKNELLNFELEHLKKKKENANLQIQAIINQLNPHFIKNAIQWVQIRILKDKEATIVLGKLEKNINIIFINTKEKRSFHRLEEELILVENYLYIQKKRFGDRISIPTFDLEVIQKNLNLNVPLMILQIHCENACEHGTKKNPRSFPVDISIQIKEEVDFLHFIVEDTGVGRAKARENGSEGTQRGVKMIEELIEIYNPYNSIPMKQWYDDGIFEDEFGTYGTRVHILIPRNYKFNIE